MRKLEYIENFSGNALRTVFDAVATDQPGLRTFLGNNINSLTDEEMRRYITKCYVEKAAILSPTQVKVFFNGKANDDNGKPFTHIYVK